MSRLRVSPCDGFGVGCVSCRSVFFVGSDSDESVFARSAGVVAAVGSRRAAYDLTDLELTQV